MSEGEPTYLNISIVDSKQFPSDELYTELATSEGVALFECASLLKSTGIDLMDCPLQINLKLFVRKRLASGAEVVVFSRRKLHTLGVFHLGTRFHNELWSSGKFQVPACHCTPKTVSSKPS